MSDRSLKSWLAPWVSPAVFDFWAGQLNPAASWDRPLARVVARRAAARDAVTLILKPNRHVAPVAAGQHVNVTAEVEGVRVTRSYSPSHDANGHLAVTVREVPGGRLSTHLCRRAQVGDVLELGPGYGQMTGFDGPRLFLAAGSGITPLMSLIRAASRSRTALDLHLVYWTQRRADRCFADELQQLSASLPGLRCHTVLTREPTLLPGEHRGRPEAALLAQLVPDLAVRQAYACGPDGFVDSLRGLLAGRCASFEAESFTPPRIPATVTGTVRVELARSGRTLDLPAGSSLLEALEAQGVNPAYGCRMGLCNTCACGKRAGTTQNLVSGDIDGEPSSALRLCVNRAASDLILDL